MNEKANDLVLYLFPAYLEAPDEDFWAYIRSLKDKYTEEGMELTPVSLMDKALHKYQNLADSGMWKAPSESKKKLFSVYHNYSPRFSALLQTSQKNAEKSPYMNIRRLIAIHLKKTRTLYDDFIKSYD